MKKRIPTQLIVGLAIVVVGGGIVLGEYFLVKWYPKHEERVREETLKLLPYRNSTLGMEMQVAAGIYGKVSDFPGGVRIDRSKFWSIGPSLTITSQANPGQDAEFSPQVLAKWQTQGVTEDIPSYRFQHTKINNRDAVLIWQYKDRLQYVTARVISPERIVEATCSPGRSDEELFMEACEESLHTIKVEGPEPEEKPLPGILELKSLEREPQGPRKSKSH